jgi:hypothetical protein
LAARTADHAETAAATEQVIALMLEHDPSSASIVQSFVKAQLDLSAIAGVRARFAADLEVQRLTTGVIEGPTLASMLKLERYEGRAHAAVKRALKWPQVPNWQNEPKPKISARSKAKKPRDPPPTELSQSSPADSVEPVALVLADQHRQTRQGH